MRTIKNYYRPRQLDEALDLMSRNAGKSAFIAGGTSLKSDKFEGVENIIDLQNVGLDDIAVKSNRLEIGAMVRLKDLIQHQETPHLIREMAQREGPNTFRNVGTVGGVVLSANSESELYAAFLVHDALITIKDQNREREIPLTSFAGFENEIAILARISIETGGQGAEARVARTPADSPIVAVVGRRDEDNDLQLAFCGIGHRPILATLSQLDEMTPHSDYRGSSEYRRQMAMTLGKRVLSQLEK